MNKRKSKSKKHKINNPLTHSQNAKLLQNAEKKNQIKERKSTKRFPSNMFQVPMKIKNSPLMKTLIYWVRMHTSQFQPAGLSVRDLNSLILMEVELIDFYLFGVDSRILIIILILFHKSNDFFWFMYLSTVENKMEVFRVEVRIDKTYLDFYIFNIVIYINIYLLSGVSMALRSETLWANSDYSHKLFNMIIW